MSAPAHAQTSCASLFPPPVTYHARLEVGPHCMVAIDGTVRSAGKQWVKIAVKHEGKQESYDMYGEPDTENGHLYTKNKGPGWNLSPVNYKREIEFTFYHQKGAGWELSKLKPDCFSPSEQFKRPSIVEFFYFRAEDSVDNDYNDTVMAVSVIHAFEKKNVIRHS